VFRTSWHYVGHTGMPADPGSYFPARAGGIPIVVTRDAAGTLRALGNVCRHRGAIVCEEPGTGDALRCPYHAWTYGLDGRLRTAPRSGREPHFAPGANSLRELPVGTWGPFIFAAADPAVPPLDEVLADLPDRIAAEGIDVDTLVFRERTHMTYQANWKICIENYLECYHCRVAHPEFARVIDTGPDAYVLTPVDTYSSQYGPVQASHGGSLDTGGAVARSNFHLLYPDTTINIYPGEPNLSIGPVLPSGTGTTDRFLDYFVGPDADEAWIASWMEFDDRVGREDLALVESVQRGMDAALYPDGTLFVDSEELIVGFHDYLRRALG
jgi:choline monooxygenase